VDASRHVLRAARRIASRWRASADASLSCPALLIEHSLMVGAGDAHSGNYEAAEWTRRPTGQVGLQVIITNIVIVQRLPGRKPFCAFKAPPLPYISGTEPPYARVSTRY
jgi:hypothetical protein